MFRTYRSTARVCACLAALTVQIAMTAGAQSTSSELTPPLMDRQKEMALALSACPPTVAGKAAVYLLDKGGYVKVRDSRNGFTAIVQHSMPTSQEPQCMDTEGTRTLLPRMLQVARLRAEGKRPDEVKRTVAEDLAKGLLQPASRTGVDYMLSTENMVPDEKGGVTHFPPHVMFYAPYLTNADLGSGGQSAGGPAFVAGEGTPYALIIVPVGVHGGPAHSSAAAR